jgi:hypothetical protein
MEIAAFASFLVLVIAWLVLPLRVPAALAITREEPPVAAAVQAAPVTAAA